MREIGEDRLIDEKPYNYSNIRIGFVPSGMINNFSKGGLALGKLIEFVSEDKKDVRFGALIKNARYEGKEGIILTDYNAEELHSKSVRTFDERHPKDLYRMEFSKVAGDYAIGMFVKWNTHPISEKNSLVLYIPKNKVFIC